MNTKLEFNIKLFFKGLFFLGCCFAFLGLFLEFYSFQGIHYSDGVVISWNYNPLTGWISSLPYESYNASYKPEEFNISIIIHVVFMVIIIISVFCMISKGLNYTQNLNKLMLYAYINFFMLILIAFYVFIFPLFFLTPNGFHFPIIYIINEDIGISFQFSVGLGYIMELIAFICVWPYILFYFQTIRNYEIEENDNIDKAIRESIKKSQRIIDLEQKIAQERVTIELKPNYD